MEIRQWNYKIILLGSKSLTAIKELGFHSVTEMETTLVSLTLMTKDFYSFMPEDETLPYNFKRLNEAEHYYDQKCVVLVIIIIILIIQTQQK